MNPDLPGTFAIAVIVLVLISAALICRLGRTRQPRRPDITSGFRDPYR
jgi:hypothetical protein